MKAQHQKAKTPQSQTLRSGTAKESKITGGRFSRNFRCWLTQWRGSYSTSAL